MVRQPDKSNYQGSKQCKSGRLSSLDKHSSKWIAVFISFELIKLLGLDECRLWGACLAWLELFDYITVDIAQYDFDPGM
jgi:hypothetical protein